MRVAIFAHAFTSCWNNGNAHFLRGVARALVGLGHRVQGYEAADSWSRRNLVADHGPDAPARMDFPVAAHDPCQDLDALLDGVELVLVHEWNEPMLVSRIGTMRRRGAPFVALFHDTHHRAVSDPDAIRAFDLSGYDGVLAFGRALADVYERWGLRVHVWHEAADITLFQPPPRERRRAGVVWIGNFGDGERTDELQSYLLAPCQSLGVTLDVHGVRYPAEASAKLAAYGARYHGWIANADVPSVFAAHLATVHVPRRQYATLLPGIPTIRVFEALACGIPLVCAPWEDVENLFRPGLDYLVARTPTEMKEQLRAVLFDSELRRSLVRHGLESIRSRHTCDHRAQELIAIAHSFGTAHSPAMTETA